MTRSPISTRLEVLAVTTSLSVMSKVYAAALEVRDVAVGDSIVVRITTWICRMLTTPDG